MLTKTSKNVLFYIASIFKNTDINPISVADIPALLMNTKLTIKAHYLNWIDHF